VIGYHWSPSTRRASIKRHGLIVGAKPHVNRDHANGHISLARNPASAWLLSGRHMKRFGHTPESETWDLWQVDLAGIPYRSLHTGSDELVCRRGIPAGQLTLVGHR